MQVEVAVVEMSGCLDVFIFFCLIVCMVLKERRAAGEVGV